MSRPKPRTKETTGKSSFLKDGDGNGLFQLLYLSVDMKS